MAVTVALAATVIAPLATCAELERSALGLEYARVGGAAGSLSSGNLVGLLEARMRFGNNTDLFVSLEGKKDLDSGPFDAVEVRELLLSSDVGQVRLQGGIGRVFWGVAESRHLVNIVNQPDLRFDSSGLSVLGQPMLSAFTRTGDAEWRALALPCHRPQVTPVIVGGTSNDTFVPIHCDRLDLALRYQISEGPLDLGIVHFNGVARDPVQALESKTYPLTRRWSADAQVTLGAWLLKLEAVNDERLGQRSRHASVTGFEYALSFVDLRLDYGLLFEHLEETGCAPLTCGDMVGLRVSANDVAGSELLVSTLRDHATGQALHVLRGQRRLGERFQVRVDGNRFGDNSWLSLSMIYSF